MFKELLNSIDIKEKFLEIYRDTDSKNEICTPSFEQKFLILESVDKKMVVVAGDNNQADNLKINLESLGKKVLILKKAHAFYAYQRFSKSANLREHYSNLYKIILGDFDVLILSPEILLQRFPKPDDFSKMALKIKLGQSIGIKQLEKKLIESGYTSMGGGMIHSPSEFSKRGDILDIFPINYESPVKISFFDDVVEEIFVYDETTFTKVSNIKNLKIAPNKMLNIGNDKLFSIIKKLKNSGLSKQSQAYKIITDINLDAGDAYFESKALWLLPFLNEISASIFEYIKGLPLIVFSISELKNSLYEFHGEFKKTINTLRAADEALEKHLEYYMQPQAILKSVTENIYINFSTRVNNYRLENGVVFDNKFEIHAEGLLNYSGNYQILFKDIDKYLKNEYTLIACCKNDIPKDYFKGVLKSNLIKFNDCKTFDDIRHGEFNIITAALLRGVQLPKLKLAIFGNENLFERQKSIKQVAIKTQIPPDKEGDLVVHEVHGIGVYKGVRNLDLSGYLRDYAVIEYKDKDILYVPVENLYLITKYLGDSNPRLNKLGGHDFEKIKRRVRRKVRELAFDLINLYAERKYQKGFKFSLDSKNQMRFESRFEYDETEDQIKAIRDVKKDLESHKVMDRLICGDVGFGKTEVAMRAAFKAIENGKQVVILSPTTILSKQHYDVFTARLNSHGFKVAFLNRFIGSKEKKETIKGLESGKINLVSGTHMLLGKDIKFFDLGLLILDEEQKFGVSHKEKIKLLKKNVDTLTLTATPIPRTLHMSLIGIRDVSIIQTPPKSRFAIQTFISKKNKEMIRMAIKNELARNGQVLIINNFVHDIERVASEIKEMFPNENIAFAHGQMNKNALNRVVKDLYNNSLKILVATTIIENGIDLPNANTIVVLNSDKLGLGQMYQLRGRVGRSDRVGYAYFLYGERLSQNARERLNAIKEFSDLGSGIKLAMRDLEIRGAGDVLGSEQHGHINKVGFNMYQKILSDTIRQVRDNKSEEFNTDDIEVKVDLNAYIPKDYVPSKQKRIEIYGGISSLNNVAESLKLLSKLKDFFGEVPQEIFNLVQIVLLKKVLGKYNVGKIKISIAEVSIEMRESKMIFPKKLIASIEEKYQKIKIIYNKKFIIDFNTKKDETIDSIKDLINVLTS